MDLAASRCWTSLALKSGGSAAITALAGTTFSPKALRAQRGPLSAVAHSPPNRYIPYIRKLYWCIRVLEDSGLGPSA